MGDSAVGVGVREPLTPSADGDAGTHGRVVHLFDAFYGACLAAWPGALSPDRHSSAQAARPGPLGRRRGSGPRPAVSGPSWAARAELGHPRPAEVGRGSHSSSLPTSAGHQREAS